MVNTMNLLDSLIPAFSRREKAIQFCDTLGRRGNYSSRVARNCTSGQRSIVRFRLTRVGAR